MEYTSMSTKVAVSIGPKEHAIIRSVWQLQMLTADQVARLYFAPTSIEYVRRRLKALTEAGYLTRKVIPRAAQHGSSPFLYLLGRRGVAYLRQVGEDLAYYPSEHDPHYLFIYHTMAVNDILIAASLLRSVQIRELRTEWQLKKMPLRVESGDERITIIPDAWIDFGEGRAKVALELDRGTEEGKKWRRKVRGYVQAVKGTYQEVYGTTGLTIAVVATSGHGRARGLRRFTEDELREQESPHGHLFLFTDLPDCPPAPEELFHTPRWFEPFTDTPVPLLRG